MKKKILITGATDGIGFEAAKKLVTEGHHVILHGRNPDKMKRITEILAPLGQIEHYICDLSDISDVISLGQEILKAHPNIDVLINNAGILKTPDNITKDGLDIRFAVNTIAPYCLTKILWPALNNSRVINLSSAAQAPVNLDALMGNIPLSAMDAYAQSKLAITMWSVTMAAFPDAENITIIPVNPGSLLASKMVKEGFGIAGNDIQIGADILVDLSLEDAHTQKSGCYFDNDIGAFGKAHPDTYDREKCQNLIDIIEKILSLKIDHT